MLVKRYPAFCKRKLSVVCVWFSESKSMCQFTHKSRIDFPRCLNARDARAFCEGRLKYPISLHLARQHWWVVKGIYCIIYVPKYGADRGCRNRMADKNAFCVFKSCQCIFGATTSAGELYLRDTITLASFKISSWFNALLNTCKTNKLWHNPTWYLTS